jgi:hypothetical protein
MSALITWPLSGAGTILTSGLGPSAGGAVDFRQALVTRLATAPALAAIIAARIYPEVLPETAALPALVYSVVSADRDYSLQGPSGIVTYRVQFSAFARTRAECAVVLEALRQDLSGLGMNVSGRLVLSGTIRVLSVKSDVSEIDSYNEPDDASDAGTHQAVIDYLFKVRESKPTLT